MVLWYLRLSRDVEQVDAHEDDQEAAKERYGIDRAGCVETLE